MEQPPEMLGMYDQVCSHTECYHSQPSFETLLIQALDSFRGFNFYSEIHGSEQAVKILANERLVLERIDKFVTKHNVPCDFNLTTTFDVCMTPEFAAYQTSSFNDFKNAGGDVSHIRIFKGEEAKRRTRIAGAHTAYEWPAGTSHPAKLAHWLLNAVVSRGVQLFTHCLATKVTSTSLSKMSASFECPFVAPMESLWEVSTPRGTIVAPTIIHCTNAYAGLLLPDLSPHITPNRSQVQSWIPSPKLSGANILSSTYSLRYSFSHFYSLIQRQGDGTLIFGVSRGNPNLSRATKESIATIDDSYVNEEMVEDGKRELNLLFPVKVDEVKVASSIYGEGLDHTWVGILAMTTDRVPFVGAIDTLPGQYVCAGFGGHGELILYTESLNIY